MDISIYFEPIKLSSIIETDNLHPNQLYNFVKIFGTEMSFPDIDDVDIALVGVNEGRASVDNLHCSKAPDAVRKYLYALYKPDFNLKIIDLGNIKPGKTNTPVLFCWYVMY